MDRETCDKIIKQLQDLVAAYKDRLPLSTEHTRDWWKAKISGATDALRTVERMRDEAAMGGPEK